MDSPVQQPGQQQLGQLTCTACGKRFRYKPDLAGKTVSCPCGARIMVPRVQMSAATAPPPPVYMPDDAPDREYDMGAPVAKRVTKAAPPVGLAAHAGAADEPFDDDDDDVDFSGPAATAPAPVKTVHVNLPPQRRGLKQEERKTDEPVFKPSTMRDWIVPSIVIGVGIVLRFIEVMAPWATQNPMPIGEAFTAVALKLFLSVFLMMCGMMLAVNVMEICFLGPMSRTAYKLLAIAVGPGALYGIISFAGGETYGAMIGTFVSVAVYLVLFWALMRLELWETGICVVVTWILVTAANYAAYRAQGLMQDSWV